MRTFVLVEFVTFFRTDVLVMINPVLTLLVDLMLIGCALLVIAAMVREYVESRKPSVGQPVVSSTRMRRATRGTNRIDAVGHRMAGERRRVA